MEYLWLNSHDNIEINIINIIIFLKLFKWWSTKVFWKNIIPNWYFVRFLIVSCKILLIQNIIQTQLFILNFTSNFDKQNVISPFIPIF